MEPWSLQGTKRLLRGKSLRENKHRGRLRQPGVAVTKVRKMSHNQLPDPTAENAAWRWPDLWIFLFSSQSADVFFFF